MGIASAIHISRGRKMRPTINCTFCVWIWPIIRIYSVYRDPLLKVTNVIKFFFNFTLWCHFWCCSAAFCKIRIFFCPLRWELRQQFTSQGAEKWGRKLYTINCTFCVWIWPIIRIYSVYRDPLLKMTNVIKFFFQFYALIRVLCFHQIPISQLVFDLLNLTFVNGMPARDTATHSKFPAIAQCASRQEMMTA